LIELINVTKIYKNNKILNDISVTFDRNLHIIYGNNGSGKSTLLKILSSIIYKTSGSILTTDIISYLPDKFSLPKLLSVDSYINLTIGVEYQYLVDKYKIPRKLIGNLSKGNLQKVGLLQVLYHKADCYILDEPLDGLDDEAKILFKEDIKRLLKDNKIVIMSLHEKNLFSDVIKKEYSIKDGKLHEEN